MNRFGFNVSLRNTSAEIRELGETCLNMGLNNAIEVTYYEDMQDIDTFDYNAAIHELIANATPQVPTHISAFNLSEENTGLRSALLHEFDKCCQYTMALGGREIVVHCGRQYGALHVPVNPEKGVDAVHRRVWDLSVQIYRRACAIAADCGM